MGRIKDFIAKWQSIDRPEWEKEIIQSQTKIKYNRRLNDKEVEWVIDKEGVDADEAGHEISIVYDELDEDGHAVYAIFDDSESESKVHYETFEHRKDAKDRLESLLDEYTEIEHRMD